MRVILSSLLLLLVVGGIHGYGNFKSYNNEARKKFQAKTESKLNEVDSADLHWARSRSPAVANKVHPPKAYDPTWGSLDSRPLPPWYDQSKIGIFIHWGVFSVPGLGSEWFWKQWTDGNEKMKEFMQKNYKPSATYQEFAPQFTAEFYDPEHWAKLFQKSGARYVVLTSKHHEGYTLWPSRVAFSWNAMDVGSHRDLLGELADAVRAHTDLKFGLYHSLYEWYNPLWMSDTKNNHTTDEFVRFKTMPELFEIVNTYLPEIVWSDGEWEAEDTYWQSLEFLAWLYNDSPVRDTVVTNDRWGHETLCHHGGFYTCADRYNPGVLPPYKWENAMTLDKESWGYRRDARIDEYMTPEELMIIIAESVSCGGNVLVNVGPTREGTIPPIQEERLLQMGEWLEVNGDAIYSSIPYTVQNDTLTPGVWYTMSPDKSHTYGMITKWPGTSITLASVKLSPTDQVRLLGYDQPLSWSENAQGQIVVQLPRADATRAKWVWTLDFSAN